MSLISQGGDLIQSAQARWNRAIIFEPGRLVSFSKIESCIRYLFPTYFLASLFTASGALGFGRVGFDTSSFLKSASDRETSSTTILIEPKLWTQGSVFEAKAHLIGYTFASEASSFTPEIEELYVATSSRLMPHHQVSVGRKIEDWSEADENWDLGLWSPRFLWDPLRPTRVGLVGGFYQYQSRLWRLRAYASPIAVPERGFPIRGVDGKLEAGSPFFVRPPSSVEIFEKDIPVRYDLKFPSIQTMVLRPSAAVSLKFGDSTGPWVSTSYGLMPIHQPDIAVDGNLDPINQNFDADLHPRFRHHHLLTTEVGFRASNWSIWGSFTRESPIPINTPENWFFDPTGPASIGALGGTIGTEAGFRFDASFLTILEKAPSPRDNDIDLSLPSRFPYRRAFQAGGRVVGLSSLSYYLNWTYDLQEDSQRVAADVTYRPGRVRVKERDLGWTFGLGADLIVSDSGEGWIGQYQGDDRIRGTITYEF